MELSCGESVSDVLVHIAAIEAFDPWSHLNKKDAFVIK
jgi:hypothetical protein